MKKAMAQKTKDDPNRRSQVACEMTPSPRPNTSSSYDYPLAANHSLVVLNFFSFLFMFFYSPATTAQMRDIWFSMARRHHFHWWNMARSLRLNEKGWPSWLTDLPCTWNEVTLDNLQIPKFQIQIPTNKKQKIGFTKKTKEKKNLKKCMTRHSLHNTHGKADWLLLLSRICVIATKTAVARATFYGSGAEQSAARASITRRNGPSIVPPPSPLSLTCRRNPSSRQSDDHDLFHKRLGMICNIYIVWLYECLCVGWKHKSNFSIP